jgi:hypothetical protein
MVRDGGDLGVLANNRRRDQAAALHKTLQGFEPFDKA